MKKLLIIGISFLTMGSAFAQGSDYYEMNRRSNSMRDSERAQERQADSFERMERIERDRNTREDRAYRNHEIDMHSMRRFDKH